MTMEFGDRSSEDQVSPGRLGYGEGYDVESPTRTLLQVPSPSGSPVPADFGGGSSDVSMGSGPPLHGVRVELSPKEKDGRRKYPPHLENVMTSKDIFGKAGSSLRLGVDEDATPVYSVNYFGVHQGEMGVLSQKRKIPNVNKGEVIRPRTTASGAKAGNPRLKGLTPFGMSLAEAVLPQEELLPPNIRLDPSYTYLRSTNTAPALSEHLKLYRSQQHTAPAPHSSHERSVSPLHDCPGGDIPDDHTVNTINSALSASSFERNASLSPAKFSKGARNGNQEMDRVQEDEESVDSAMAQSHFSKSTLGVPNPGMYDQWTVNNALPGISRSLSRGGLFGDLAGQSPWAHPSTPGERAQTLNRRATSPPSNTMMHNQEHRVHSDHRMVPRPKATEMTMNQQEASQVLSERTSVRSRGGTESLDSAEPIPYIVHSAPMGWKLTTPARKRFVEATAQLAGYGDNEFLPLPEKLSQLGTTMGLPAEFDGSLRKGNSGPAPKLFVSNPSVSKRSLEAAQRAVDRSAPPLKWRGLESHRIQLKKVDAKLRATLSGINRPAGLVDPGESVYGTMFPEEREVKIKAKLVKVGGKRVKGRKFRSQSTPNLGKLEKEEAGDEKEDKDEGEVQFTLGELFGIERIV